MEDNKPQFIIDDDPIVEWPVIINLPSTGGTFNKHQFSVLMRVLSPAEYEKLFAAAPATVKNDESLTAETPKLSEIVQLNAPIFQRLITDWNGVNDREGNPVAYTPEKLAEQITGPRGPALSVGLWHAINEIRYGARLGN